MPKAGYTVGTEGTVALSAATAKTVLAVVAPTHYGTDLRSFEVGFDGVTASNTPATIEIITFTTDGTGTAVTVDQGYGRALPTTGWTAKKNYSAEPSGTVTTLDEFSLSPNGGLVIRDWPLGEGFDVANNVGIGIRVTAAQTVNVRATLKFERC